MNFDFDKNSGGVFVTIDGTDVKHFLFKNNRWYVTWGNKSPLTEKFGRSRMFRSHFVYMMVNNLTEIGDGFDIHHEDRDKKNDKIENLIRLSKEDHKKVHEVELRERVGSFSGKKHKPHTLELMRKIASKRGNNNVWLGKSGHRESTKIKISSTKVGVKNPSFRGDLKDADVINFYNDCKNLKKTADNFGCSISAIRSRVNGCEFDENWRSIPQTELLEMLDGCDGVITKLANTIGAPQSSLWRKLKGAIDE